MTNKTHHKNIIGSRSGKGFTLIELFIVIGILVTIAAIVVLVLNPVEYLRRARDAQRLRDYALINQAVNFYSYNTSVGSAALDYDGPNYADSCKGQSAQRIFVSVPSDNGEADPTPPSQWTYNRVPSNPLRFTNGTGWLPIDFTDTSGGVQPLSVLPVDPLNTFDSGFFYTYTCGSYELNLRFESEKYRQLAETDSGNESDIYELGNDLGVAPVQAAYHPTEAAPETPAAGTIVLYPSLAGTYTEWIGGPVDVDDPKSSPNDSDFIYTNVNAVRASTFALTDTTQTGTITAVRLVVRANRSLPTYAWSIRPRLRSADAKDADGTVQALPTAWTSYTYTYTTNPTNNNAQWTWSDINGLQAGVVVSAANTSGRAQVSQIYLEVDYEN